MLEMCNSCDMGTISDDNVLSLIMLLMVPSKRQCKTTRLLRCCKIAHLNF